MTRASRRHWAPLAIALAASVAFRLPAILHADQTNSDAAVVGLQAMHFLRGEWSWFLWGSGYQTSVDSLFAAIVFGFLGPTPRALLFSSLGLHLALTALAWSTLARRIDPTRAALAITPLVFTSSPLQTYVLYPPREAALAIAVASIWALDRAADARRARAFVAGGAILGLACFADPYALVLVPPIAAFGIACAFDRDGARASLVRIAGLAAGGVAGGVPAFLLRESARATHGQLALDSGTIAHNARLLVDPCLPWALGARAWEAIGSMDYVPWRGPDAARAFLVFGGAVFLLAIVAGGACVFARSLPWSTRRLAIAGGLALPVTVAGFLASPMVMDLFSSRYLVAIPLLAPFALGPLAAWLGAPRFALAVAPAAVACAVAGWVGYGPFLRAAPTGPSDEAELADALDARDVHVAMADYWAAYRLTFLTGERILVVPTNPAEDRYPPYRAVFDARQTVAYVFDPERSREHPAWLAASLAAGSPITAPFAAEPAVFRAGRFVVAILHRRARARDETTP